MEYFIKHNSKALNRRRVSFVKSTAIAVKSTKRFGFEASALILAAVLIFSVGK